MTETAYTLRIMIDCPHCRSGVAVNGFTEEVLCDNCLHTIPLNQDWWEEHISSDKVDEALESEPGYGISTTSLGGMSEQIEMGNRPPRCQSCKHEFDNEMMQNAVKPGFFACPGCRKSIRVRVATPLVRTLIPEADLLVNEDETGTDLENVDLKKEKPLLYACLSCGSALKLDGNNRTVSCSQCGNDNFLPDALWLRLHPAKISHAFFITRKSGKYRVDKDLLLNNLTYEKAIRLLKDDTINKDAINRIFNEIEEDDVILIGIAKHPNTDHTILLKLCDTNYDYEIRENIAKRENLPLNIINILASDSDSHVKRAIMKRKDLFKLPDHILRVILLDADIDELGKSLTHKDFPEWKLYELSDSCAVGNANRIMKATNVSKRVLKRLGTNPDNRPNIKKHPIYLKLSWWQKLFFFEF